MIIFITKTTHDFHTQQFIQNVCNTHNTLILQYNILIVVNFFKYIH